VATANKAADFLRMSRLDSFIARMQAQRDCLNFLPAVDALPGRS
jgi:hypothetical protein